MRHQGAWNIPSAFLDNKYELFVTRIHRQALRLSLFSPIRALYRRFANVGRVSDAEDLALREYFDAKWYLETYPDVADAGVDPLRHFLEYGEAEGRNPSGAFSTTYYRNAYMQAEPPDASPLRHFLRVGRVLGLESGLEYLQKISTQNQSYGLEIPELLRHIQVMPIRPIFLVYLDYVESSTISQISTALRNQIYPDWIICDTRESVAKHLCQPSERPPFLVWLSGVEALHSSAFYCFASAINADPETDVIYGDEDEISDKGDRSNPFFKPDWSPDYLESCNFLGSGTCIRGEIVDRIFDDSQSVYDIILRATEIAQRITHIRQVLVHRRRGLARPKRPDQIAEEIRAIEGRLTRTGRPGKVSPLKPGIGCYLVNTFRSDKPLISVVLPTAGRIVDIKGSRVELVLKSVEAVLNRSTYKNLEVIAIDDSDINEARMSVLRASGVKTVSYRGPESNTARKINLGAAACRGEFLLLLDDDVEPLNKDWIERLLDHMWKPHVGVVGAKLLSANMTTQHLGIVLLNGVPYNVRKQYPRGDEGYFFSSRASRNFIAVTGAAMLTRVSLFREVGGFTEALPMRFHDIDYCLKIRDLGAYSVFSPEAELVRYEFASKRSDVSSLFEMEYFTSRWAAIVSDPFYNQEELTTADPTFEVNPTDRPLG
jgi:GT2 family glycosyltransferase